MHGPEAGNRGAVLRRAALRGAAAGVLGVATMTTAEKLEQMLTHRPSSYVPGRTLAAMTGRDPREHAHSLVWNHAMHWGTGAVLGVLRGVWAATGVRGPRANLLHAVVRVATDQTVENAAGTGAPPQTWPPREQVVDFLHKTIYAVATGVAADRLVSPTAESRRGTVSR